MIAGLFVVSTGLFQTGIAARLGRWLGRAAGTSEVRLIALVMIVTALLSGFMSSTGTVAVMLPVVVSLAWRARISPSKLLIPLTMASLLGGMTTLIGTPPNLVASNQLVAQGMPGFGFFAFTPLGLAMLLIGLVFMVTVGRHWLPSRAPASPGGRRRGAAVAGRAGRAVRVAHEGLPRHGADDLAARRPHLRELGWPERHQVQVLAIDTEPEAVRSHRRSRRHLERSKSIGPGTCSRPATGCCCRGSAAASTRSPTPTPARRAGRPERRGRGPAQPRLRRGAADAALALAEPDAGRAALPRPLRRAGRGGAARRRHHHRGPGAPDDPLRRHAARRGHAQGVRPAPARAARRGRPGDPGAMEAEAPRAERAPIALAIMVAMLVVMTFGWVPNVVAVGVAAVLMVLSGCLTMDDAYRGINWEAVVLIAAILPMATALEITGGLQLAVDGLVAGLGPLGPFAMIAGCSCSPRWPAR
jgi:hypothetical protein